MTKEIRSEENMKEANIEKILQKYDGAITGLQDLTGDEYPSWFFYIFANQLSYLLDTNPEVAISEKGIKIR